MCSFVCLIKLKQWTNYFLISLIRLHPIYIIPYTFDILTSKPWIIIILWFTSLTVGSLSVNRWRRNFECWFLFIILIIINWFLVHLNLNLNHQQHGPNSKNYGSLFLRPKHVFSLNYSWVEVIIGPI